MNTNQRDSNRAASGATDLQSRLGSRLRRARVMAGLSLRGLADAMDRQVSHAMLQKLEAGESVPDSRLLARLSQALHVRPDYFFKSDSVNLTTKEYRSQTKLGVKKRQRLEEQAYEFFDRYLEVEAILKLEVPQFPIQDLSKYSIKELPEAIERAAEELRKRWQLGMNPIPNIHTTLEDNGVKVRALPHEEGFDGLSAFAEGAGLRIPVIALSKRWLKGDEQDLPRFRFTAVHELAHLCLVLPDGLTQKEKETSCHRFAGAFLVPQEPFRKRFGVNRVKIALNELCAIKAEWGISVAAIMKRADSLGLISNGRFKAWCMVSSKNGWRKNDPGAWVGTEESNRFERLVLRALAQDLITTSKAAGLLGFSLSELAEKFNPIV